MRWASPSLKSGVEMIAPADVGQLGDIARVALFPASDEARLLARSSLVADGGRLGRLEF
jgi:NAD(P)-dependent dehydrogenase (short-subunit alcohol dehydrogenase family)